MPGSSCPFCAPDPSRVERDGPLVRVLWDAFPNAGHALVTPVRHITSWDDATSDEKRALLDGIDAARAVLRRKHRADGFRVAWNEGREHLHLRVIPRIHGKASERPLVTGEARDPLLAHLAKLFPRARRVDIAVAFVLERGVERIRPHLPSLLERSERPGALRIVTGDYRDVTEPLALERLLDLPGDADIRVFETGARGSFHPKAYIFHLEEQDGVAFVGSSNLTATALGNGLEWSYRVVRSTDGGGFEAIAAAFEELLGHERVRPLTDDWIRAYGARRRPDFARSGVAEEPVPAPPTPHAVQREALAALAQARREGATAGLVVLATGLGKTWLSAFDSEPFERVLFVAHRGEILTQAIDTFRRIRPRVRIGRFTGSRKNVDADILFASVQALSRVAHLGGFAPDAFDYVIVDEFHHACAATYRRLLQHFRPRFLLGLTATPERSDGGDLLGLCGDRVVFRYDLGQAVASEHLAPLRYFGVPDDVDYTNIPWRSSRFHEEELTRAVATEQRAANALQQLEERGGDRALGFCCSTRHADFMAAFFRGRGKRAVAVHSAAHSAPRAQALEDLERGALDIVFCVDMFNEGVDLPRLDTVLMLRPTESRVLWLQQIGRGLRKDPDKSHVTVIDYIGNHRSFLEKVRALTGMLLGAGEDRAALREALRALRDGTAELPAGCEATYDLEAIEILDRLLAPGTAAEELVRFYEEFRAAHDVRPTASEVEVAGALRSPRVLQRAFGGWFQLVRDRGDLAPAQAALLARHAAFFGDLESTDMNKSLEMLVVLALVEAGQMPGALGLDELAARVAKMAEANDVYRADFGERLSDSRALRRLLASEPIRAWTGGKRGRQSETFAFDGNTFEVRVEAGEDERAAFAEMVREIVEWRLTRYRDAMRMPEFECAVWSNQRDPILKLPDRKQYPYLPEGAVPVTSDGAALEAVFAKIAINLVRRPGETANRLPGLLRGWFGSEAGRPGRRESVVFERAEGGYRMRPRRPSSGLTRLRDDMGNDIDASFAVEDLAGRPAIRFFSRGGTKGTAAERNADYNAGLELLLARLAARNAVLVDALVDSGELRDRDPAERRLDIAGRPFPLRLAAVDDVTALRREIGRAQAKVGRRPEARGSGNATKTIRLDLERWPEGAEGIDELARALR